MSVSIASELDSLLDTVSRPGDFWTSGMEVLGMPSLEVDGAGQVALPLLPVQARQLIACAEPAPYGRGETTIIDQDVRRTWQIGPDRVRIGGRRWAETLATIVARAAEGLGVSEPVDAEFYKLLVYDEGSFFVGHRDTEKAPGMFATLLIVLPSRFAGGTLIIRHRGREIQLDLHSDDPAEAAFTAFYADCVHEVLPITQGYRLTLVYNLLRRGKGRPPRAPSYVSEQARLTTLLQGWRAAKQAADEDDLPEKLIYLLEHAYTPAELGFDALKGADAARAGVLSAAAREAQCDLHLALLTIEESGIAEYSERYERSRRGRWVDDAEAFEAGEVDDRSVILSDWQRPDGAAVVLGPIPVERDELAPPDAGEDLAPDEEHFHEATGNEGASFERTYRRAALVLWPSARIFAVLNQAGLAVTLPYLDDLVGRWEAVGAEQETPLWCAAHELTGRMVAQWPKQSWYPRESEGPSEVTRLLTLLTRLRDTAMIERGLRDIVATGHHEKGDNDAIIGGLACLPAERLSALLEQIIAGTAATAFAACADLLARVTTFRQQHPELRLVDAARPILAKLPGDPAHGVKPEPWQDQARMRPGVVVDLLSGLAAIDATLAERAADHILARPQHYAPDSILIPALRRLTTLTTSPSQAIERLRAACLAHLRARTAEPLAPPPDWRRASKLSCRCSRCADLARFLDNTESRTWIFKAAEADRAHLQGTIKQARCDVDTTTDKRGRPYGLMCVKNQASYDRRAKQREQDLADLMLLER
ncbi:MAG: 2OG-Fe(II) oxygenase [Steroidobacteraceae bacterium]|nr:2OG-Fe(II) oxygenase [Steroidobacteraceae bacterium]